MQSPSSLFESVFKRPWDGPNNREYLSLIANEHPYFSPAQFFLLKETEPGTDDQKKVAARTAVLFSNPHWLNFQLQRLSDATGHIQFSEIEHVLQAEQDLPDNTDNNDDESLMEKEIEPMHLELKMDQPATQASAETPLFEPMHLVDYFASQGIKLTVETQTADKLGKQLKSFTEWLKTMKKLHTTDTISPATQAVEPADSAIQSLAEKSNTEGEVLTESMAEVFAKQGKTEKAAEVYRKLSLLDPSKIAYFAAKIEQLKGV
jgi:hypothetical protein